MLIPAPRLAAKPTKKVALLLCVARAAAKSGEAVLTPCKMERSAKSRMAERARPVTVSERQSAGACDFGPRTTSTTSPLVSSVRRGLSSPLTFTPTQVSPTSVWTA